MARMYAYESGVAMIHSAGRSHPVLSPQCWYTAEGLTALAGPIARRSHHPLLVESQVAFERDLRDQKLIR